MKIPEVLSFDPTRIKFVRDKQNIIVEKLTTIKEYRQMVRARYYLCKNSISLQENTLPVMPASILKWDNDKSTLVTMFCSGINGEEILRNAVGNERLQWIKLFKEFLLKMRLTGFLWGDCAPRNMIIDLISKHVWIVDFERQMILTDTAVEPNTYSRYIRNYAWEEFSCFLFAEEQKYLFSGILTTQESKQRIAISDIKSGRKKELLISIFGQKDQYDIKEIWTVETLMVSIATPFYIGDSPIYPMDIIDQISSKGGPDAYVEIVQKLRRIVDPKKQYQELNRMSEAFK